MCGAVPRCLLHVLPHATSHGANRASVPLRGRPANRPAVCVRDVVAATALGHPLQCKLPLKLCLIALNPAFVWVELAFAVQAAMFPDPLGGPGTVRRMIDAVSELAWGQ